MRAVPPVTLTSRRLVLDLPGPRDIPTITRTLQDRTTNALLLTCPWPYTEEDAREFAADFVPRGWSEETELTWAIRPRAGVDLHSGLDAVRDAEAAWRGASDSAGHGIPGPSDLLGLVSVHLTGARDIGYWLAPEHRGHGFMQEAVSEVLRWLSESDVTPLDGLGWSAAVGNVASANVVRRNGFAFDARRSKTLSDGGVRPTWFGHYDRALAASGEADATWPVDARPARIGCA